MTTATSLKHVYEVYIRTTPDKLWQALTDPEISKQYFYGGSLISEWRPGSSYALHDGDGNVNMLEGKVLEVDKPRKLVHTFLAVHDDEQRKERPSRVTWQIEPLGEVCKLTVTHDGFVPGSNVLPAISQGWPAVLSSLKTLLETGSSLRTS